MELGNVKCEEDFELPYDDQDAEGDNAQEGDLSDEEDSMELNAVHARTPPSKGKCHNYGRAAIGHETAGTPQTKSERVSQTGTATHPHHASRKTSVRR